MLRGSVDDEGSWFMSYTRLEATLPERFAVASPNNPAAADGEVLAAPGNRLCGDASEVLGRGFDSPRFLSPGAPRGAWLGIAASR